MRLHITDTKVEAFALAEKLGLKYRHPHQFDCVDDQAVTWWPSSDLVFVFGDEDDDFDDLDFEPNMAAISQFFALRAAIAAASEISSSAVHHAEETKQLIESVPEFSGTFVQQTKGKKNGRN
ncbi:MAG: hypothetical protein R3Y10_07345 [Ferrimonas sp.]